VRRILLGIPFLLSAALAPAAAQKDKPAPANVYKSWVKSVAWVVIPKSPTQVATGSASLIDLSERLILTNYHVVRDDESAFVFFPQFDKNGVVLNDRTHYLRQVAAGGGPKGKVIAKDPKRDLAVIKLDALPKGVPAIRLARDGVGPSDRIHCIGNPGVSGGLWSYTPGDVKNVVPIKMRTRSRNAPADSFEVDAYMIENTAPTNEGDSGGPVLNDAGEQVGVTQGYASGEGARAISYAVDLREIKQFLKEKKLGRLLTAAPQSVTAGDTRKVDPAAADPKADAEKRESAAAFKLDSARNLIARDKKADARAKLEEVIKTYPDTKAADQARKLLDEIK
jgi:S1-C subfamily serine protease